MPTVTFLPMEVSIEVPAGTTLLQAAQQADVFLRNVCGGQAICATCRFRAPGSETGLSPVGRIEQKRLKELYAPAGTRLACQTQVLADAEVVVPVPTLGV